MYVINAVQGTSMNCQQPLTGLRTGPKSLIGKLTYVILNLAPGFSQKKLDTYLHMYLYLKYNPAACRIIYEPPIYPSPILASFMISSVHTCYKNCVSLPVGDAAEDSRALQVILSD